MFAGSDEYISLEREYEKLLQKNQAVMIPQAKRLPAFPDG